VLLGLLLAVGLAGRAVAVHGAPAGVQTIYVSLLPADSISADETAEGVLASRRALFDALVAEGGVLEYRPHLGDGYVAVDATAHGAAVIRRAFPADVLASADAGVAEQARRASVNRVAAGIAPGPTLTANLTLGDSSVFGVAPPNKTVTGKLLDAKGNTIATASDVADGGTYHFFFGRLESVPILPGYKVKLQTGVRRLTAAVPKLTVLANRTSNVISGVAPRNAGVSVGATHFTWTDEGTEQEPLQTLVVAGKDGKFAFDATVFADLVGGDMVSARLSLSRGAVGVTANATIPYVVGYLERARISGLGTPSKTVGIAVRDRQKKVIFSTMVRTGLGGVFNLTLTDGTTSVTLQPKMTVVANFSGAAVAKLPQVTGALDVGRHVIRGKGPPNTYLRIQTQQPFYTHYGQTDGRGRYEVDLAPGGSVSEDTLASVVMRLPGGDLVLRYIE
jgi:hypothetical protein